MVDERAKGGVGAAIPHDSGHLHVSGEAIYIDDIAEARGTLYAAIGMSERAHARLKSVDLTKVRAAPGVVAVITAKDIPGKNDYGPVIADDPIFATALVQYHGQSLFAVAARTSTAIQGSWGRVPGRAGPAAATPAGSAAATGRIRARRRARRRP